MSEQLNAPTRALRERIENGPCLVVPGAANALAARIIEDVGFEAVYVTGAGIANTYLGAPDIGLVTLSELSAHVGAIRQAVSLPLVVDADTGFGNAVNVRRTVSLLERAGADAIQLEDQVEPKRCGHFEGKSLVSPEEMASKVRAAVEARSNPDLVVIARTDARAVEGYDAALARARQYAEAGADMTFVEAPSSEEELRSVPRALGLPQVANLVEGGKTPLVPVEKLDEFRIVLFANVALQAAIRGMQEALGSLYRNGEMPSTSEYLASWNERQQTIRKPEFDQLGAHYAH